MHISRKTAKRRSPLKFTRQNPQTMTFNGHLLPKHHFHQVLSVDKTCRAATALCLSHSVLCRSQYIDKF